MKIQTNLCLNQKIQPHTILTEILLKGLSIVNLGLQAVALARAKMPDELETTASRCNSLKALRAVAQQKPDFVRSVADSLAPVKILLSDIARQLELKEKKFKVFTAATASELDAFWTALLALENFTLIIRKK